MTAKPKKTASTTGKTSNSANSGAKRNTGGARRKRGNNASGNDFDRMKSVHLWLDENDQVFAEYRK